MNHDLNRVNNGLFSVWTYVCGDMEMATPLKQCFGCWSSFCCFQWSE